MLMELRIENVAVIERLSLRLEPGLNVLTGETGAGKSIVVGALSLLLGERASTDVVRAGAARAVVEGVFDSASSPQISTLLSERGVDAADGLVILRREIVAEGRSRAWINGAASTAGFVGAVGRLLVDLHGQHEHQSLLLAAEQRVILDAYGADPELLQSTRAAHEHVRDLDARLAALDAARRDVAQRAALLRVQADEIEKARLVEDEEAALEAEAHRLAHAEEITRLAGTLHQQLYGAEHAVAARLAELRRTLDQLVRLDASLGEWSKPLEDAFYATEELGRAMGDYASRVETDPGRLDAIRGRQDLLFRLRARYGPAIADVIAAGRSARAELARLDEAGHEHRDLEAQRTARQGEHVRLCAMLTARRTAAAQRLDREMLAVLPGLGMPDAQFHTVLTAAEPGPAGAETVEFHVSVNAGFEAGPIARIASGGELARLMLALKATLARQDRVPTLVFDEIDAGIGGRAAQHVALRLRDVSRHHQVVVVTHLAQIAAHADHHFHVEKTERGGMAATFVQELHDEARTREIARLLGGDPASRVSLDHARELIRLSATGNAAAAAPSGQPPARQ